MSDYDSYDAVLHWIFRSVSRPRPHRSAVINFTQALGDTWFKPTEENISAGVCLRIEPGQFRVFPYENPYLAPFEAAIRILNPLVAVKVRTAAVHSALATVYVYSSSDASLNCLILYTPSQCRRRNSHLHRCQYSHSNFGNGSSSADGRQGAMRRFHSELSSAVIPLHQVLSTLFGV